MKFYRVHYYSFANGSDGYGWFTSRRKAETAAAGFHKREPEADRPEVEVVEVNPTKREMLAALEQYASHADNG